MSNYIASYDLEDTYPSPYSEFIKSAEFHGWHTWIRASDGLWYRLPNTTLIGSFKDSVAAVAALNAALTDTSKRLKTSVRMTKYIVSERGDSRFISDEKVADE